MPWVATVTIGLSAALLFGLIARRIGLSPIVGYLVAGVAVGPHTPGLVGDAALAGQIAEVGVILLVLADQDAARAIERIVGEAAGPADQHAGTA